MQTQRREIEPEAGCCYHHPERGTKWQIDFRAGTVGAG
jgi:hypothetical protein